MLAAHGSTVPVHGILADRPWIRLTASFAIIGLALYLAAVLVRWSILDAVWQGNAAACREAAGACWAFIREKYLIILFGLYPADAYWRPVSLCAIFLFLFSISAQKRFWGWPIGAIWIGSLAIAFWFMSGGFGLQPVPTSKWGGLPLSLLLAATGLVGGFPLAVILALMRRSELAVLRWWSRVFVETVRGVPLIAVLFISAMVVPLFLPPGIQPNKLVCAQIGLVLFAGAYMSEIVRAGMQIIGRGQFEAARSLGLGYFPTEMMIVLPQVVRAIIPALVTTAIGFFQDTTLVIVIGLFDLLNTARAATVDPAWLGFYFEAFLFVGVIYFVISAAISRYGSLLESHLRR